MRTCRCACAELLRSSVFNGASDVVRYTRGIDRCFASCAGAGAKLEWGTHLTCGLLMVTVFNRLTVSSGFSGSADQRPLWTRLGVKGAAGCGGNSSLANRWGCVVG